MTYASYVSAVGHVSQTFCTKCFAPDHVMLQNEIDSGYDWSVLKCYCQKCNQKFEIWNFAKRFRQIVNSTHTAYGLSR